MDTYNVSLRIVGQSLDLEAVTAELGLVPTNAWRVGDFRIIKPVSNEDLWEYEFGSADSPKQWESSEAGLRALLEVVCPLRLKIAAYQRQYKVCFWCGYFSATLNGGPHFSPALLKELGELGIPVQVRCFLLDRPD